MARISDLNKYYYDYNISDKDYLLGTNADNNNKTQSYPMIALADYVRNFLTNMNYDKVISIGEILSIDNTIIINVNNLGNVVYIGGKFYSKNTQDVFTFTPVTEGVKVIILYALPDEQIFYMLEGEQSLEAIEPTLPNNALFIRRIIVTEQGININPNDVQIIDEKVQITENTDFAQTGQTQKDFNKKVSDYKASSDLKNQEQDDRMSDIESENIAQNNLINGLQADLDNQIAINTNQDERIVNLEGINYTWSPTNRTLTLYDNNGNQLSQVSLVSLDNEGTDIRYNASTLSLELYNADNELLDSIPVSSFIGSVGTQLQLNSNQLQLRDSQGNILSTVTFEISNINGLQIALDNKLNIPTMTNNYYGLWDNVNKKFINGNINYSNGNTGVELEGTSPVLKLQIGKSENPRSATNKSIISGIVSSYSINNGLQYNVFGYFGTTVDANDIFTQYTSETNKNWFTGILSNLQYFNNSRYSIINYGYERFTILNNGNIGVNNANPTENLDVVGNVKSKSLKFYLQTSITPTPNTLIAKTDGSGLLWYNNSTVACNLIIEKINTTTILTEKLGLARVKLKSYTKSERDALTNKEVGEMIWQTDSGNSGIRVYDGTNWLALQTIID